MSFTSEPDPSSQDHPSSHEARDESTPENRPGVSRFSGTKAKSNLLRRRRLDKLAENAIFGVSLAAISIIFLIFVYVAREAWPLIAGAVEETSVGAMFMSPFEWRRVSINSRFSVIPLLVGTPKVTLIAMLVGTPIAWAAALYTAEFAHPRLKEWIKPTVELLAGIPSAVVPEICGAIRGGGRAGPQRVTGPEVHCALPHSKPSRGASRHTIGPALHRVDEHLPRWVFFDSEDMSVHMLNGY